MKKGRIKGIVLFVFGLFIIYTLIIGSEVSISISYNKEKVVKTWQDHLNYGVEKVGCVVKWFI